MKICIAGYASSGKTTVGEKLAKDLNIKLIGSSYKNAVDNDDRKLLDMLKKLIEEKDSGYGNDFDKKIIAEAAKQDCVVTTWAGSWIIKDATLRVWLNASQKERAKRRAYLNGEPYRKTLSLIKEYDTITTKYLSGMYGIDFNDHSIFDLEINTERLGLDDICSIISLAALAIDKKNFD